MSSPIDTMARTLWGEARGCGAAGMRHVASVILNRAAHPSWWGKDVVSVCTQPNQFSCWNSNDPNHDKLLSVSDSDTSFVLAQVIAKTAVEGKLPDDTKGADSYYALSMKTPPVWAKTSKRTYADGWHVFYKTVNALGCPAHPDVPNKSILCADDLNARVLSNLHGSVA
jgi:N-acetylmuramoyl-L-alanine amidase